jgi:hypothetical protein
MLQFRFPRRSLADMSTPSFDTLIRFLATVPAVRSPIGRGSDPEEGWWVKFSIDIAHPLAWQVVQEFGHVLNYLSPAQRLPTTFLPVSPPPYMNGGPAEFLSWVIECRDPAFTPDKVAEWLEGRLPRPVDDPLQWQIDVDDEEDGGQDEKA